MAEPNDVSELRRAVNDAIQRRERVILVTSDCSQSRCSVHICNTETAELDEYLNYVSFILWRLLGVARQAFPDCGIDIPTMAAAMGSVVADATELYGIKRYGENAVEHGVPPSTFALLLSPKEIGALQHVFEKAGEDGFLTPKAVATLRSPIKQVADISRKIKADFDKLAMRGIHG